MEKMISEFRDGDHISGQFLVSNSAKCVNNSGGAYINLELKDSSGVINGKKWEATLDDENLYKVGSVVYVEGEVLKYKESLQLKVLKGSEVDPNDIDIAKFIKNPPVPKEELIDRFNKYVESIQNEDCRKILRLFLLTG